MTNDSLNQELQDRFLNDIKGLESIKFISFEAPPEFARRIHRREIPIYKIAQLAFQFRTRSEILEWIIDILRLENVQKDYFFRLAGLPWAKVAFGNSYDWVEPLWYRPREPKALEFCSIEGTHWLLIEWTEACIENNCYIALSSNNAGELVD